MSWKFYLEYMLRVFIPTIILYAFIGTLASCAGLVVVVGWTCVDMLGTLIIENKGN